MRRALLLTSLVTLTCGCNGSPCRGLDDPDGLWERAARVRVDLYGQEASCQDNLIVASGAPAISRTYDPHQAIQLDVPRGLHTVALTLFSDSQATTVLATACLQDEVSADTCLRFSLRSTPDGGCQTSSDCVPIEGDGGAAPICCGHRCVDPANDPANCGDCTVACGGGHTLADCHGGACSTVCADGWASCDSACIPSGSCCTNQDCAFPPSPPACFAPACSGPGGDCSYPLIAGAAVCGATCCRPSHARCAADCTLQCASGFSDCDGASDNGCECEGSACCGGACPVKHDNGEGQHFFDCVPSGTFDQTQATEACVAFTGDPTECHPMMCGTSPSVCSDGSATACDCWMYEGSSGKVKENPAGSCDCRGNNNTASWN